MKTILWIFIGIALLLPTQLVFAESLEPEPSPVCPTGTIIKNDDCVVANTYCGEGTTYQDGLCVVDKTEEKTADPSNRWGYSVSNPYAESPLKQIQSGVSLIDVQCSEGKHVIYKYNRMRAACVSEVTQEKLWNRGWATMRFYTEDDTSPHALCNNYEGKWHPEYEGCRDITDLQCSLMGGEFVDGLKICYNDICPADKTYTLCVTNLDLVSGKEDNKSKSLSVVKKLLSQNHIDYSDKLVVTGGPTIRGDPGCGAVVDVNNATHWFGIDSISEPKKITLYSENPNQCEVNTASCFCNAQRKLTALTLDELSYFTLQEEEKYAKILIDYLDKENINRTPKFQIGKFNLNYADSLAVGYCGELWGTNTYDFFEGAFVKDVVEDYSIHKELSPLCAISDNAKWWERK